MPELHLKKTPAASEAYILSQSEDRIVADWIKRVEKIWNGSQQRELKLFSEAITSNAHALQYLIALPESGGKPNANFVISKTIERVQSEEYNIADLFSEIKCLREAIDSILPESLEERSQQADISAFTRQNLDRFFEVVARETSVIYEFFAERGNQPFLILESRGNITYANSSARSFLGLRVKPGESFTSFIAAVERDRFEQMLEDLDARPETSPIFTNMQIDRACEVSYNIDIELAKLDRTTERSVYYVSMSTAPQVLGVGNEALEKFDEGVLRIDSNRKIVYANSAISRLIGPCEQPFTSMHIHDFFEGEDLKKIEGELHKREQGELSHYEIDLTRPSGGKIPVSVYAIPELNSMGKHTGSVAIIRNLFYERVEAELAECVLDSRSRQEILEELFKVLHKYVNAEIIAISRYTDDMSRSAIFGSMTSEGEPYVVQRRWFPLNPAMRDWISEPGFKHVDDFAEFVKTEKMAELADDTDVQDALKNGIKSFMATPIMSDGTNKTVLTFAGMQHAQFCEADAELLSRLSIDDVVLSALQRKDREDKTFQSRFMTKLSRCNSFQEIARRVTKELAGHYHWDNVSLFDVAVDLDLLTLIKQRPGSELNYRLDDNHTQTCSTGLLGKAVRELNPIYARDVNDFEEFVPGHVDIKSELIVPIFSRMYKPKRVFWLLNIEDTQTDFLNDEELEELTAITEHIEFVVNRMIDRVTYNHAITETHDGIIVTDANGDIRMANPMSLKLLNYADQDELLERNIVELFSQRQMGEYFVKEDFKDNHKIELQQNDAKGTITVMLSKLELPTEISDKYFVFKSLETEKHLANLVAIDELVGSVARQIKTPLSLMQGMLNRLNPRTDSDHGLDIDSYVERARKLLKNVELTYDRLAYSEAITSTTTKNFTYVHLEQLFYRINRELGTTEEDIIVVKLQGEPRPIHGDRHQLRFVCDSIVSFLLRNLPSGEKITVEIVDNIDKLVVEIQAPFPPDQANVLDPTASDIDRIKSEIELGSSAIQTIIENHRGDFRSPELNKGTSQLKFEFELPVARSSEG